MIQVKTVLEFVSRCLFSSLISCTYIKLIAGVDAISDLEKETQGLRDLFYFYETVFARTRLATGTVTDPGPVFTAVLKE